MASSYTPKEDIPKIRDTARRAFLSGKAKSLSFRKEQIAQVGHLLKDNEDRLKDAINNDIGRHPLETDLFDFGPVYNEVRGTYDNLEKWARPQNIDFNISWFAMGPKMQLEPKGVVLIVAPFNLPILLTLSPLVSAIAAGNAVCIKPSEQNPTVNAVLAELLPKYLDTDLYHVINGGIAETTQILEYRWDHSASMTCAASNCQLIHTSLVVLYIGGHRVGRIIAMAAAKHLTPVTLELGGKNPVVLDPKVDIKFAAKRLLWGRFANAGQICTCPDYLLVPREILDSLVAAMKDIYQTFYPDGPERSDSFARIISEDATRRIKSLLEETQGAVVLGGQVNIAKKYVAPTVVTNVEGDDALMREEIFGPVLMLVPVQDVDEAIAFIQARENPLAVYVFSSDKKFQKKVFSSTRSGAAIANDTVLSPGVPGLPVGGIGGSGYGYYAGKHAFEQFSHWRVALDNPSWVDTFVLGFRFPPYRPGYKKFLSMIYSSIPPRPKSSDGSGKKRWAVWLITAAVGAASVLLTVAWSHS